MKTLVAVGIAIIGCTLPLASAQRAATQSLVIDGSRNPELIPEWYIWEQTFLAIGRDAAGIRRKVAIDDDAVKVLLVEGKRFDAAQAVLAEQLRSTRATLTQQRKSEDAIRDATDAHELDYRYKILEARLRISETLAPENMLILRAWIDQQMAHTKIHLRGRALKIFQLPG